MKTFTIPAFIVIGCWMASACVNLDHVHRFADNATTATKKFADIPFGFAQHCRDRCVQAAIDSFRIVRTLDCPCDEYERADSVTKLLYRAVAGYFDGLYHLSSNERAQYPVDRLEKAIQATDRSVLHVKKEEVDAYATIADLLLRGFADSYRRNKIRSFITDANAPVQVLLAKLEWIESKNLTELIAFNKEQLFDHYRVLLKGRRNDVEKEKLASEYYQAIASLTSLEKQLASHVRTLKTVAKGHQALYDQRNKLSGEELRRLLVPLANDLQDLIEDLDNLKQ